MRKIKLFFTSSVTLLFCITTLLPINQANAQSVANDPTFDPGSGFNDIVRSTSIQSDGKIIVGGDFTSFNGTAINRIARLHADGSLDTDFDPSSGFNGSVWSISLQADGKIIVGGDFTEFNGTAINRIARLHADGTLDTGFDPGSGFNARVWSTSIQADGKIIVGGNFTDFNGIAINRIARLNTDGSLDATFNLGTGFNNQVETTSIQADGKIIVGGNFTDFNGIAINRIARLNADGTLDTGFDPGSGFDNPVFSTSIQADGKIIVGGEFYNFNGTPRNYIARLNEDGSLDTGFDPGSGFNNPVFSTPIQADGKIIVGGAFTSFNGTLINRFARLNADGTLDTGFDQGSGFSGGYVWSTSIQADGKIIVGGDFSSFNGIARNRIARILECTGNNSNGTAVITACDAYTWIDGVTYTSSNNTATHTLTNAVGCDSIVTLNLTINNSNTGTDVISVCDAYTWIDGVTYTSSNNTATYTLTNAAGCDSIVVLDLTVINAPIQEVCVVTVDEILANHNIIFWEKPADLGNIDSFYVYREITFNTYQKIGAKHVSEISDFSDFGANPNTTSYKYKITTLDTCGNESEFGLFHKSIHLQYSGLGNFQWTFYEIENTPNQVASYNFWRDDAGDGSNWQILQTVSGSSSSYTDINYANFPNAIYRVDLNWINQNECTSTRANINTSRSNTKGTVAAPVDGIFEMYYSLIQLYPNPTNAATQLYIPEQLVGSTIAVTNAIGQVFYSTVARTTTLDLDLGTFANGIYFIKVDTGSGIITKKLVKN
jgi:uncharacterized delta-60 repeat protein